jgi:hypothetical protein
MNFYLMNCQFIIGNNLGEEARNYILDILS